MRRRGQPHLEAQSGIDELGDRRELGLSAEACQAAVRRAPRAAGDAVAVRVGRIAPGNDRGVGDRFDESESEQERRREAAHRGRARRDRFALHPVRAQQRRRLRPDVLAAFAAQEVARARSTEPGGLDDTLETRGAAARGNRVARAALVLVE